MSLKIKSREAKVLEAVQKYGQDSHEATVAVARLEKAKEYFDATPEGLRRLKEAVEKDPEDEKLTTRLLRAEVTRNMQVNALKELRSGRVDNLTKVTQALKPFYDEDEAKSIIESSRENTEMWTLRSKYLANTKFDPDEKKYQEFVDSLEASVEARYGDNVPSDVKDAIKALREAEAPDAISAKAYYALPKAFDRSRVQLIGEIRNASALQGVDPKIGAEYYEAYRRQYKELYAHLPEKDRPDPPSNWIRGEFGQSGYAKDPNSSYAPHDPASIYAMYRLRADENAVPDYVKQARSIASIDLETAGPSGREGFEPEYGRIIEVGVQVYAPSGKKVAQIDQLVKPEDNFLQNYGTGAQDIHQIKPSDLDGKPDWKSVSPQVSDSLQGKILLAQNVSFEKKWLAYHLPDFDTKAPIIDTLEVSRKHFDLPNHRLETICGANKVPYTNGHRALHDAEVAAQAFFQQKRNIQKMWASKPARRKAEAIRTLPAASRWTPKKKKPPVIPS
jgi:DNA polymerase-3 subunit epsilon